METSDGVIVGRVKAGDVDAYQILVERYYQRVFRYAWRMLGEEADAQDVVQDVFVRAYRSLASYRDEGRFDAWLFRIVLNRCRSVVGRRERDRRRFVPLDPSVHAKSDGGPDLVLWRDELRQAMDALSPRCREAFLLKFVEDLSYDEMAELTGDGVSALKMRVNRARGELRSRLAEVYRD